MADSSGEFADSVGGILQFRSRRFRYVVSVHTEGQRLVDPDFAPAAFVIRRSADCLAVDLDAVRRCDVTTRVTRGHPVIRHCIRCLRFCNLCFNASISFIPRRQTTHTTQPSTTNAEFRRCRFSIWTTIPQRKPSQRSMLATISSSLELGLIGLMCVRPHLPIPYRRLGKPYDERRRRRALAEQVLSISYYADFI